MENISFKANLVPKKYISIDFAQKLMGLKILLWKLVGFMKTHQTHTNGAPGCEKYQKM